MNTCEMRCVVRNTSAISSSKDGLQRIRYQLTLSALEPGDYKIGPIELRYTPAGESSPMIAMRVERARAVQLLRNSVCNARLEGRALTKHCELSEDGWAILESATDQFNLSARAYQRVMRVGRTIADLADELIVSGPHIAEALSLRQLDRRIM